ncbi:site-specific integrase [Burkholderia aenigmatica]|uniref:site-specific integrase n=1 Tax=Burkholderia aenigmatica TaxID=2015348 RepID=UPI00264E6D65|nr:site-specific integrase [Burkholderia aenigmatica]MDN7880127.1 site-specific integrase [Burkholderia aenigmatica]
MKVEASRTLPSASSHNLNRREPSAATAWRDILSPDTSVAQALTVYTERISIHKRGWKQETYRANTIGRTFIGTLKVSQVTTVEVANYRDLRLNGLCAKTGRPVSANTVRLELAMLSDLFSIAIIEWGICKDNPVTRVRKPKIPAGRDRRVTLGEERRLLRAASEHRNIELHSMIVLAIETAMRQGELLGLRWEHIDLQRRTAHLPLTKNGSKRDVPLSLRAIDALTRLGVQAEGDVFGYTSDGFKSAWRVLVRRLGLFDLHFHDLRHEAVSRLFELGTLDMMEVATISGHKSMQMLKRYTHLKASNLVAKLDGRKALQRGKQVISQIVVPYPAIVKHDDQRVTLEFVDFAHLRLDGVDADDVAARARDILLRELVNCVRASIKPPVPTPVGEGLIDAQAILIHPL